MLRLTCEVKEEAYVNNMENYNASVSHRLASTQFPGEPYGYIHLIGMLLLSHLSKRF
jgi:hypothetical protein